MYKRQDADSAATGVPLLKITVGSGAFAHGTSTNGLNFNAAAAGVLSKTSAVWSGVGLANDTAAVSYTHLDVYKRQGEALQTLSGLLGTGSTGILTLSGSATQPISGLSSAGVLGTATTSGDAIQSLSGLLGTGNAGVFTTSGTANQTLSGLTGTGTVGSFTLSGNAAVALPAVLISSALGVITASAGGNIAVTLSGVCLLYTSRCV